MERALNNLKTEAKNTANELENSRSRINDDLFAPKRDVVVDTKVRALREVSTKKYLIPMQLY